MASEDIIESCREDERADDIHAAEVHERYNPPSIAESIIDGLTEFAADLKSGVDIESKYRVTTPEPTDADEPDEDDTAIYTPKEDES